MTANDKLSHAAKNMKEPKSEAANQHGSASVLRVMRKDIRGATRDDWDNCPIARAMKRVYPGNNIQVLDEYLLINGKEFAHTEDIREYIGGWNEWPMSPATLALPADIGDALRSPNGQSSATGPAEATK